VQSAVRAAVERITTQAAENSESRPAGESERRVSLKTRSRFSTLFPAPAPFRLFHSSFAPRTPMESLFGISGDGYVLIAADSAAMRNVVKFKDTEDKIIEVDSHKLMGVVGPSGDRSNFTEFVLRNIHLYELRNGVPLSTHATANWTRYIQSLM
jgi:hypothetical protein